MGREDETRTSCPLCGDGAVRQDFGELAKPPCWLCLDLGGVTRATRRAWRFFGEPKAQPDFWQEDAEMLTLRYDRSQSAKSNTFRAVRRGSCNVFEVTAYVRVTDQAPHHLLEFLVSLHRRGTPKFHGAIWVTRRDESTWIVEPHRHREDMPLLTLVLTNVPDDVFFFPS